MAAGFAPPDKLPPRLAQLTSVDDVLDRLQTIIDWAIEVQSTVGYFAALYKRVTLAVKDAIAKGEFDDGPRMTAFDVHFAQRYVTSINAFFYGNEYPGLTQGWRVALGGNENQTRTIVQHLVTALNVHISLDLAITAFETNGNALDKLESDFLRINRLIANQVPDVLDIITTRSPVFGWIRRVVPDEVRLVELALDFFRNAAWKFAIGLAFHPDDQRDMIVSQDSWTSAMSSWYLYPPRWFAPAILALRIIAKRESRDVAANIRALDGVARRPRRLDMTFV